MRTVKIGFNESSKAITADVTMQWQLEQGETFNKDELLKEVTELFEKAQAYAANKTMRTKV